MKKEIHIPVLNYSIAADLHERESSDAISLVFVGFSSSKQSNSDFVARLANEAQQSAIVLDFSGHGDSQFKLDDTSPAQHLLESVAAFDWIQQTYPGRLINVIGTSYGGFMAAYLCKYRPINRLVLRTPAIYEPSSFYTRHQSIDKIAVREYRRQTDLLVSHPIFTELNMQQPPTLLVVHGNDESIPTTTTDIYRESFDANVYTAEGFVHAMRDPSNPTDKLDEYHTVISDWLRT